MASKELALPGRLRRVGLAAAISLASTGTILASKCHPVTPEIPSSGYWKARCGFIPPYTIEIMTGFESVPPDAWGQKTWSIEGDVMEDRIIRFHAQLTVAPNGVQIFSYGNK